MAATLPTDINSPKKVLDFSKGKQYCVAIQHVDTPTVMPLFAKSRTTMIMLDSYPSTKAKATENNPPKKNEAVRVGTSPKQFAMYPVMKQKMPSAVEEKITFM